jgi:hypothetical protein
VFSSYKIYKTKTALDVALAPPRLLARGSSYIVDRQGAIMLSFAKGVEGEQKVYDWKNKIMFSLSVNEIGSIIAHSQDSATDLKLLHNPTLRNGSLLPIPSSSLLLFSSHFLSFFLLVCLMFCLSQFH